jgi:uncharacterized UBP type Zn finger protein
MVWGVGFSVYASTSLRLTQGKLTQHTSTSLSVNMKRKCFVLAPFNSFVCQTELVYNEQVEAKSKADRNDIMPVRLSEVEGGQERNYVFVAFLSLLRLRSAGQKRKCFDFPSFNSG